VLVYEQSLDIFTEDTFTAYKVKDATKKDATIVDVGLHINNFPNFNIHQNQFAFDGFIWFKYPKNKNLLDTISKFDFKNGEIKSKSEPIIKTVDNSTLVSYHVKVEFKTYLNFKDFPLGDHRLNIILDNRSVTPKELCFNTDKKHFLLSEKMLIASWEPKILKCEDGYLISELQKNNPHMKVHYPCATFSIAFHNTSSKDIITLYFPMFVLFFICLFSLLITLKEYVNRMFIIVGVVPILVLFRMVIVDLSPVVGEMTKADFVYFLLVFLSLIILIFQAFVSLEMRQINSYTEEKKKIIITWLKHINDMVFLVSLILLLVLSTYNSLHL
jgi:hypothetical protein